MLCFPGITDVLDQDLFAVFGSSEGLREEDRLLYEAILRDGEHSDDPLTDEAHTWCTALIRTGHATTFQEALTLLRDMSQEFQTDPQIYEAPVWSVDLTAKRPRGNTALRKLVAFTGGAASKSSGFRHYDQRLGIASHAFVRRANMGDFAPVTGQLELFDERANAFAGLELYSDRALRDSSALNSYIPKDAITEPGVCDPYFLQDLEAIRKEAWRAIRSVKYWHQQYTAGRPFLLPLAGMLAAIEYPSIAEFVSTSDEWRLHLTLFTMLNWARILRASQKRRGSKPLYITEVPIVCRRSDGVAVNVGRLDCVEVAEINGKKPTRAQYAILRRIQLAYECGLRPKGFSIGTICFACISTFGGKTTRIKLRFRDWKISVGDTPNRRQFRDTFSVKDVADRPFPRHAHQIERYDCSLPNDQGMSAVSVYAASDSPVLFEDGILDYQCHDGAREHAIVVTPDQRDEMYARIVERANGSAGLRAQVRALNNAISNRIYAMTSKELFTS
ncbi:MAG: hypothetical protein HY617_02135 [Candidatus Sungbacteria bacterium]|nr:hypothetical protein [Candidatus Sungbacteria bacterium]